MLKIDSTYENKVLYVRLSGSLNERNSYKITNYLIPLIEKYDIKYIVYNLKNLLNIDLKGTDAIISSKLAVKKNKGQIFFSNGNKNLKNIFMGLHIKMLAREKDVKKMVEA